MNKAESLQDHDESKTSNFQIFLEINKIINVIFGHFRNYLICASIFVAGKEAHVVSEWEFLGQMVIALASFLAILNASSAIIILWGLADSVSLPLAADLSDRLKEKAKDNVRFYALIIFIFYLAVISTIVLFTANIQIES